MINIIVNEKQLTLFPIEQRVRQLTALPLTYVSATLDCCRNEGQELEPQEVEQGSDNYVLTFNTMPGPEAKRESQLAREIFNVMENCLDSDNKLLVMAHEVYTAYPFLENQGSVEYKDSAKKMIGNAVLKVQGQEPVPIKPEDITAMVTAIMTPETVEMPEAKSEPNPPPIQDLPSDLPEKTHASASR